ncbi:MAG: toxin-antitoxin system TumE family protein [Stellaceae bacterium]
MARARRIFYRKRYYDDGSIAELTLWLVPQPVRGSSHSFKYSLFYGRPGVRLVGYDNEPGKGDHRHYGSREESYEFTTAEQLIRDFLADVRRVRRQTRPGEG